jgi:hypothetical protein
MSEHVEFTVGEKTYKMAKLRSRPKAINKYLAWCKEQLPDPLDTIKNKVKDFPSNLQEIMVKEACRAARTPLSLASPEVEAITGTSDGAGKVVALLLQELQPELTDDQAWEIFFAAAAEHGEEYMKNKIKETQQGLSNG